MEFHETPPAAALALESESRRRFVAQTGLAVAAATLGSTGLAMDSAPPRSTAGTARTLRVGMLLPEARAYPLLGAQLLEGAQAFARQADGPQLHFIPVAYGRHGIQAERAARELLSQGKVDVLAGFVDPGAAAPWAPMLAEHQVPLLVGDTGANALAPQARSPWIVHSSLGYWQASWAAGRWAAKALGPRAIVAVGPADSGFDQLPAFERGFASAGGRVQARVFTRAADGTSQLDALARLVRQTRPDLVFALDSGPRTADFQHFWSQSGIADHAPLVASGMLAETLAHSQPPEQGMRIWVARPWQPQAQPASAASLATAPQATPATPFHLLGHELAQRMHAGAALSAQADARGLPLARAMAAAVLQTPRGEVRLDTDSGETLAATCLQSLHAPQLPAALAMPPVATASCQGLCDVLASRVTGTYLVA